MSTIPAEASWVGRSRTICKLSFLSVPQTIEMRIARTTLGCSLDLFLIVVPNVIRRKGEILITRDATSAGDVIKTARGQVDFLCAALLRILTKWTTFFGEGDSRHSVLQLWDNLYISLVDVDTYVVCGKAQILFGGRRSLLDSSQTRVDRKR